MRNSSAYTTCSIGVTNFTPSYITLKCIYIRNSLSFNLSPKNYLMDSNLTLAALIPLI